MRITGDAYVGTILKNAKLEQKGIKYMKAKKIISMAVALILVFCVMSASASASENVSYTVTLASSTHNYTETEPLYFMLQAYLSYSQLDSEGMIIDSMQSRVWNYNTSTVDVTCPMFIAQTATIYHSTYVKGLYKDVSLPAGTSNYYTYVDWKKFASDYYKDDAANNYGSNKYPVPANQNVTDSALLITMGIVADEAYKGIIYNYNSYWFGDGHVDILDSVANTPYWTSKTFLTLTPTSLNSVSYSIDAVNENDSIISAEDGKLTFSLKANSDNSVQYTSLPVVATDENFENIIEISEDDVAIIDGAMSISADCDEQVDTLYIKMPDITIVNDDAEMLVNNVSELQVQDIVNEEAGTRLLQLTFDADTFDVTPNSAVLLGDEEIKSVSTMVFFDEDNNVISGTFIFSVPDDYEYSNTFDMVLKGELIDIKGEVYEVSVS